MQDGNPPFTKATLKALSDLSMNYSDNQKTLE